MTPLKSLLISEVGFFYPHIKEETGIQCLIFKFSSADELE